MLCPRKEKYGQNKNDVGRKTSMFAKSFIENADFPMMTAGGFLPRH
jgi:hypothetical protein